MDNLWVIYGSGWWYTYPSEKYESNGMTNFPIYEQITNVPKHQPEYHQLDTILRFVWKIGYPEN